MKLSSYSIYFTSTILLAFLIVTSGCSQPEKRVAISGEEPDEVSEPEVNDVRWAQVIGDTDETVHPHIIHETNDGYRIVATGEQTVFVYGLGANGDIRSQRALGVAFTGNAMDQTYDGGFIFAGTRDGDMHLLKTDADGNREWELTHGGEHYDVAVSVQQTRDGGYIVTGERDLQVMGELALWKVDTEGNIEWEDSHVGESAIYSLGNLVRELSDGYVVAGGGCLGDTPAPHEMYAVKTDDKGNRQWDFSLRKDISHEFTVEQCAYDIQQTLGGGYILAGGVWIPPTLLSGNLVEEPPDEFPVVVKLDENGDAEWEQSIERSRSADALRTVQETADGSFVLAGSTSPRGDDAASQMYLVKLSVDGAVEWQRSLGEPTGAKANIVRQTAGGGYIVVGTKLAPDGETRQLYVVKTCAEGYGPDKSEPWS